MRVSEIHDMLLRLLVGTEWSWDEVGEDIIVIYRNKKGEKKE